MEDIFRNSALIAAALEGLTARPKRMSPKWFYDQTGSELFERITELPEYYPTRTEIQILERHAEDLAARIPDGAALVELGSGASVKSRLMLDVLPALGAYVPVDISSAFLHETGASLSADYPKLNVRPIAADFTLPLKFPADIRSTPKVAFFPGSTLGNLDHTGALELMRSVRSWPGIVGFILGVDLVKDPEVLVAAYDDAAGVTSEFNLNLLARLNREADADFDVSLFAHEAIWNEELRRIEMHLVSLSRHTVTIDGTAFEFERGETIHTENSHKYSLESVSEISRETGWKIGSSFSDPKNYFSIFSLVPD